MSWIQSYNGLGELEPPLRLLPRSCESSKMVHGISVYVSASVKIDKLLVAELTFLRVHDWDERSWTVILLDWSEV